MITLYSGTPGSGKSLHVAKKIREHYARKKKPVICNFDFKIGMLKKKKEAAFIRVSNKDLTPEFLVWFSDEYRRHRSIKHVPEGEILLVIDECQLLFNSRNWSRADRGGWISFFSQHRKLGYEVILIAQKITMVDNQIRGVIEYMIEHRKVKNIGTAATIIDIIAGGNLHVSVKIYLPLNEKVYSEWFRADKRLYMLYDTYSRF